MDMQYKPGISHISDEAEKIASIVYCFRSQDIFCSVIRGELCGTYKSLYWEASAALQFQSYFGWNYTAFAECIEDLEGIDQKRIVIIIDGWEFLLNGEEEGSKEYFMDVLCDISKNFELQIEQGIREPGSSVMVLINHRDKPNEQIPIITFDKFLYRQDLMKEEEITQE